MAEILVSLQQVRSSYTIASASVYGFDSRPCLPWVNSSCISHAPCIHVVHVPCTLNIIIDNIITYVSWQVTHLLYVVCTWYVQWRHVVFSTGFVTSTCLPLENTNQAKYQKWNLSIQYITGLPSFVHNSVADGWLNPLILALENVHGLI